MIFALIFSILLNPAFAAAPEFSTEPSIRAGAMIRIDSYDQVAKTYKIVLTREEAVGPNYATADSLAKAVTTLDLKRLQNKPNEIIGNEYKTDGDLKLISQAEFAKRKKDSKKSR